MSIIAIWNNVYEDISGGINLGLLNNINFELYSVLDAFSTPNAVLKINNFDILNDIKNIGDCFVNINGMV
ncbi:hypothetical protein FACS1894163_08220 [Spirochaetia bacterium]|nr:hypothetical protein FACS1894163_08220 [Spirochaetia bacterium]